MLPEDALRKEAQDIGRRLQRHSQRAQGTVEVDAQGGAASSVMARAASYRPIIGLSYQCPTCWVTDEVRSGMQPAEAADSADALFCNRCEVKVIIAANG